MLKTVIIIISSLLAIIIIYKLVESFLQYRIFRSFFITMNNAIPEAYVDLELAALDDILKTDEPVVKFKGFAITLLTKSFSTQLYELCINRGYNTSIKKSTDYLKGITYLTISKKINHEGSTDDVTEHKN